MVLSLLEDQRFGFRLKASWNVDHPMRCLWKLNSRGKLLSKSGSSLRKFTRKEMRNRTSSLYKKMDSSFPGNKSSCNDYHMELCTVTVQLELRERTRLCGRGDW